MCNCPSVLECCVIWSQAEYEIICFISELLFFALYIKTTTRNFTFAYGFMLGSENSEFKVIVFCPILKNDNSEFF